MLSLDPNICSFCFSFSKNTLLRFVSYRIASLRIVLFYIILLCFVQFCSVCCIHIRWIWWFLFSFVTFSTTLLLVSRVIVVSFCIFSFIPFLSLRLFLAQCCCFTLLFFRLEPAYSTYNYVSIAKNVQLRFHHSVLECWRVCSWWVLALALIHLFFLYTDLFPFLIT